MTFSFKDIPNLAGKTALVTGGSGGIGFITVRELAAAGAKVLLAARNEAKSQAAIERIGKEKGAETRDRIQFLKVDLLDLNDVNKAAERVLASEERLDILVNNAGIMATPYALTKDGIEEQVGVNVIAHWLLTFELLPLLVKTARLPEYEASQATVRVVQVSSIGHALFGAPSPKQSWRDLDAVNDRLGYEKLATWKRYGKSKTGNILIANTVKRLTEGERIASISLHPGNINTELTRGPSASYGALLKPLELLLKPLLLTPDQGAFSQLYAATSPDFDTNKRHAELNGAYLVAKAKRGTPAKHATEGQGGEVLRAELNAFAKAFVRDKTGFDADAALREVGLGPIE